ncbi:unnamed protein product [Trichobilharzia regenti]|nr:unnamed protein product [Trichobilharzia regenti]
MFILSANSHNNNNDSNDNSPVLVCRDFVWVEGEFEVSKGGKRLYVMGAGRCFGELALLYNCKRTASVKGM